MKFRDDLSLFEVNELLRMDDRGRLYWRDARSSQIAGAPAGALDRDGYLTVGINKKKCLAHRLVWLIANGEWPQGRIDHKNRIRTDNRPSNLRVATASQNSQNRRSSFARGTTRHSCGKFQAQIKHDGVSVYLGLFDTQQEAIDAYNAASIRFHGEYGVRS